MLHGRLEVTHEDEIRTARNDTLIVDVTNISKHGLWIMIRDKEMFLPFESFPWFKDAPVGKILNVELPSKDHLYWPELDIDLDVDIILNPERYPLVSGAMRQ